MSKKGKFDQVQYSKAYNAEHYDMIRIRYIKDRKYKERIKELADRDGISVNQWVIKAIEKELEWYE